jgi:hypothetical protein
MALAIEAVAAVAVVPSAVAVAVAVGVVAVSVAGDLATSPTTPSHRTSSVRCTPARFPDSRNQGTRGP